MRTKQLLSVILAFVMIAAAFPAVSLATEPSQETNVPLYSVDGDWSISGEHNYLWVSSNLNMTQGKQYLIRFGLTAPTGNPSFYLDWRDYANNTKSGINSWNYKAITGVYDDGSNDCVAIGALPWVGTLSRGGKAVEYGFSVLWDTSDASFAVTIDYKTGSGATGRFQQTVTGSGSFQTNDVLKFATGSTAVIHDLAVYDYDNYVEPEETEAPTDAPADDILFLQNSPGGKMISLNSRCSFHITAVGTHRKFFIILGHTAEAEFGGHNYLHSLFHYLFRYYSMCFIE